MSFTSLEFAFFLALFVPVYWLVPRRMQNLLVVAGSLFFYGYRQPWLLALVGWSAFATYVTTNKIAQAASRRTWLWTGVTANVGALLLFKYFNVLGIDRVTGSSRVLLPIGLSFYSLQVTGYLFDVYHRRIEPRRNPIDVALFTGFFPLILAGPIERARHLFPQIEARRSVSPDEILEGLLLVLWGFFKKLVIADNIAVMANKVFGLESAGFVLTWAGVFAFAMQLYADFSAYSDIARGVARWLGFDIVVNFNAPYLATSLQDFWRRWHISLSSWFRDYVFFPITMAGGGTRPAALTAVLVTFVLSGVWHGATVSFIVWGLYHAVMIVVERGVEDRVPAALTMAPVRRVITFAIVCVGWLIFREPELSRVVRDLTIVPWHDSVLEARTGIFLASQTVIYALPLWLSDLFGSPETLWRDVWSARPNRLFALRTLACAALFAGMLIAAGPASFDFIYLRF